MPVTATELPILGHFLCVVESRTGMPIVEQQPIAQDQGAPISSHGAKALPKGVVLGKDGKPCRSCTSVASWMAMSKAQNPAQTRRTNVEVEVEGVQAALSDCPPDVDLLGRSTWNMLHTMTANYPARPAPVVQQQTKTFLGLFSNLYPCSHCADDFRVWMSSIGNEPRLGSRDEFGRWMCEAHNAVNVKLGKTVFDCNKWEERWRTGPPDGHCG